MAPSPTGLVSLLDNIAILKGVTPPYWHVHVGLSNWFCQSVMAEWSLEGS